MNGKNEDQQNKPFTFSGKDAFFSGLGCTGCLAASGIGLPLIIVTLPLTLIAAIFWNFSPVYKKESTSCSECDEENLLFIKRWGNNDQNFTCKKCGSEINAAAG